jgi:arsenical pump membrane protein
MYKTPMLFTLILSMLTVLFIIWRPKGTNEAVPTSIGTICIFVAGVVPLTDIYRIVEIVQALKPHLKMPFLLSGALVATGASAPIGVRNLADPIDRLDG